MAWWARIRGIADPLPNISIYVWTCGLCCSQGAAYVMQCSPDRHRNTKLPALSPRTHSLYHPYSAHGIVVFLIRTPSPLQPPLDMGVQTEPSHHSHVGARACIYSSLGVHTSYAYVRRNLLPLAHGSLHPESTKCNFNINTRIQSRVTLSTELRVLQCRFFFHLGVRRDWPEAWHIFPFWVR